jgi:hypothetical protein
MAEFCLMTRMSPAEYRQLTRAEYIAYCNALSSGSADDMSWLK